MCYILHYRKGLFFIRFVERHQEGVGHALGGDVARRTVAWKDTGISVEHEELFEDAAHEDVIVSARVIGTTDRTGEEGVA